MVAWEPRKPHDFLVATRSGVRLCSKSLILNHLESLCLRVTRHLWAVAWLTEPLGSSSEQTFGLVTYPSKKSPASDCYSLPLLPLLIFLVLYIHLFWLGSVGENPHFDWPNSLGVNLSSFVSGILSGLSRTMSARYYSHLFGGFHLFSC